MIIPVKCFTCGQILADKYRYYQRKTREFKGNKHKHNETVYLTQDYAEKTAEGKVLDDLGLKKMCCRRHMLTHVDIL